MIKFLFPQKNYLVFLYYSIIIYYKCYRKTYKVFLIPVGIVAGDFCSSYDPEFVTTKRLQK